MNGTCNPWQAQVRETPLVRFGLHLAKTILSGVQPTENDFLALARTLPEHSLALCPGADLLRRHFFGNGIHLCAISNAKSGRCSENCAFCAQSASFPTASDCYPLLALDAMREQAELLSATPVHRYSYVTSGRGLSKQEIERVKQAISNVEQIEFCASFGILDADDFAVLQQSRVSRYHHNLETAPSFFSRICTSHTYAERIKTITLARQAGLSICCGGIFGLGESDEQVVEFGLQLQKLNVDAVPVNFLLPVKGTPLAGVNELTPGRCLKILALLRYMLPDKEIILCGGRKHNLAGMQQFAFFAGASGLMTGNYLTTQGQSLQDDLGLLASLGLHVRS